MYTEFETNHILFNGFKLLQQYKKPKHLQHIKRLFKDHTGLFIHKTEGSWSSWQIIGYKGECRRYFAFSQQEVERAHPHINLVSWHCKHVQEFLNECAERLAFGLAPEDIIVDHKYLKPL